MHAAARLSALLLALACAVAALAAPAAAAGPDATRAALEREMRSAGTSSGAYAIDLDSGLELAAIRPDGERTPASVEKLYTTSTALLRFGPEGRLATTALGAAAVGPGGVLAGDLYVRGGGDPTFGPGQAGALAATLVRQTGLRAVTGRVIGDESAFDTLRGPPSSGFETSRYVGPLGALTFNRGRKGSKRPGFQARPARFAAAAFRRALERAGVDVAAGAAAGATPPAALTLAEQPSPPMADLARRTNVPSDNFLAETLLKALGMRYGGAGSTRAGAQVVRSSVGGLGLTPTVVDGSGLSRANHTSPRQVVRLLQRMGEEDSFPAFQRALAVAGVSGTLRRRMRGTPAQHRCRGKTGTLTGVSALAGYCTTTSGSRVAFAFLMNRVSATGARRLQDRMTVALARYAPAAGTATPRDR
jgi:D-alanyl-D-alanine carboxypeptidase/D-alanyl-D-alanine-endopeptidase (penicillin-binding protein 4)